MLTKAMVQPVYFSPRLPSSEGFESLLLQGTDGAGALASNPRCTYLHLVCLRSTSLTSVLLCPVGIQNGGTDSTATSRLVRMAKLHIVSRLICFKCRTRLQDIYRPLIFCLRLGHTPVSLCECVFVSLYYKFPKYSPPGSEVFLRKKFLRSNER